MEPNQRVRLMISGRVQGVFFRMETLKSAQRIGVFGWVKNNRDGRVEAVMEGPRSKVAQMTEWCGKGPVLSRVDHVEIFEEEHTGEFKEFKIVF